MLKKILIVATIAGGGYYLIPAEVFWAVGIQVPYPIQEFTVNAADGSRLSSLNCYGRPILLITWAAWCPWMPANLPRLEKVKARFAFNDICIVPVSTDEKEAKAWEFARDHQMAEPYYWGNDGLPWMFWGNRTVPHVYLFDRAGRMRLRRGLSEIEDAALMAAVTAVIEDGSPRNKTPPPTSPGRPPFFDEDRETDDLASENTRLFREGLLDELDARAAAWRKGRDRTSLDVLKEWTVYESIALDRDDAASDADHEARIRLFESWVYRRPSSVTAHMALGRQWFMYAWKARGRDWSSRTTEEGRRLFVERLEKSRTILEETSLMPETTPLVFFALLHLSRAQGWDETKIGELLRRGIASDPDNFGLYAARAQGLIPRWGGSDEAVARFATASADARSDRRGDELYASLLWDMVWAYEEEKRSPFDAGFSWPRARAGFGAMLARRPDSTAWRSRCAKLALLAGDKDTAREMFTALGGRFDRRVWPDRGEYVRARVAAAN